MSGTTKAFTAYPSAVVDDNVANGADGDAEIPTSLVGKARFLAEHATGGPIDGDSAPAVATNPQDRKGHDHCGPPYGSALRHCLFSTFGHELVGADWVGEDLYWDFGSVSEIPLEFDGWVWVKPFPPVEDTPYSRGYLTVVLRNLTANAGDVVVTMRTNDAEPRTAAFVTAASTAAQVEVDLDYMVLVPGWNRVTISFEGFAAAMTRLLGFSVNQIAKRSH